MHIEENQPLAPLTTFGIGGPARWYVEARSEEDVAEAIAWAEAHGIRYFVLGGGSNLLVANSGFDGLVLHIALNGISSEDSPQDPSSRIYRCAAGENWDTLVERTVRDRCAGIECLAGIPGTVGGTPVQNVGAYGQEVSSAIALVRAYDLSLHAFVELPASACGFAYRRSRFNSTDRGRFIVTRVDYRLTVNGAPTLRYADLQRVFPSDSAPSLVEAAAAVRSIRQSKGMYLVDCEPDCRSAGSFFKNPVVAEAHADRIAATGAKELPRYPAGRGPENAGLVKLPAAWLIEQAGFAKGYARGSAAISSRHTLALVNRGSASASDILALADEIRAAVRARFDVHLEMEPVLLGFAAHESLQQP
jgi:UDP-N-acetylmuramate dehydrogenase